MLVSTVATGDLRKMSITKGKTTMHEYEAQVKEIRCQLAEQLRCLETRTETQTSILLELNDYYRRKAEIDMEYGKQLEKLARSAMQRHKNEKNKRECWSMHSICALWQQLVDNTREEARERNEIAELYITQLTTLISQRCDDLHKISRKCREIGSLAHGEVSRVLNELHTAMKTYQLCFAEYSSVESKYRQVEENKLKYEEENPKKRGATRKHRSLTKLFDKRLEKYDIVRVKCLKARNEYLLCVQAANAALHKYFADDLSDLIDCMDLGMEEWLRSLITCTVSSRKTICQKEMDHLADLYSFKQSLDAKADKQRFFEANHATFMLPKRFEFRGQIGDAMSTVSAAEGVAEELQQRQMQIERRLTNVRLESEEIWKSLESTERAVIEKNAELMRSADVNEQRKDSSAQTELVIDHLKNRNDLNELYDYYLNKFSHYLLNSNLIERLEARSNGIGNALSDFTAIATLQKGADESFTHSTITPNRGVTEENDNKMLLSSCNTTICSSSSVTATAAHLQHATKRKKRIGGGIVKNDETKRPRLFGGSLDEYVDATGESIPLIITSTIRVLSQFALHHQGIFRISGSQIEINSFKEAFERGEDPLSNVVDASDVNSVAGVLKLYLRELREPLFPIFLFDQLTECAKCINPEEFIKQVSPLLEKLSQPTLLVLRYLFAFLNHLSEFSDENMMDPYNLAICFGPTLLPIPEGKDQVFYHNFVNELVKNLIVYHENVFSALLPGPSYEKYLLESCDNALYIDDQEAVISGDEEISSTTAMFDSCCIERLPSIGETDYSSVNSNCNNTPTAADALHPSDVHVLSNNTPHINSRTSLSSATAVTATTTTTHVPASTIPITTGITTMPSAPVCLSSSSSCSSPARGCYRTATDHYQPIYHYHFDASSNLHHNHVDNANLNASQQQNLINVSSQKTYGGDGCLSSSGCAEAAMISLDSAFLIRRYGNTWNEQQQPGGCVSNASLTRGQSNAQSVNAEHVFNVPSSQHTSAQIWTRRTGGASSLRQQLHHTRTPTAQHNNDDPPDKDTSFAANRARLHRLSLNAASPPPIGAVAECSQMRERASETNAVNDNGLSAELHHKSSSNCNNNTTLSLRDRLAALSPMTAQLQIELKRRVLGEEIKPSISSPPPPASICSSSSSGTGVGLRSTAVIEEPPPDLVRSLPYDHHHSHSNHQCNSGTATKSIQQRENAKGETEYSYQQKGNNEEMNDRNNVLVVDCKQLVALDYSSSSTPLRMSASDTDASPSFTAHPSSITTNTTTTTPSPGSA